MPEQKLRSLAGQWHEKISNGQFNHLGQIVIEDQDQLKELSVELGVFLRRHQLYTPWFKCACAVICTNIFYHVYKGGTYWPSFKDYIGFEFEGENTLGSEVESYLLKHGLICSSREGSYRFVLGCFASQIGISSSTIDILAALINRGFSKYGPEDFQKLIGNDISCLLNEIDAAGHIRTYDWAKNFLIQEDGKYVKGIASLYHAYRDQHIDEDTLLASAGYPRGFWEKFLKEIESDSKYNRYEQFGHKPILCLNEYYSICLLFNEREIRNGNYKFDGITVTQQLITLKEEFFKSPKISFQQRKSILFEERDIDGWKIKADEYCFFDENKKHVPNPSVTVGVYHVLGQKLPEGITPWWEETADTLCEIELKCYKVHIKNQDELNLFQLWRNNSEIAAQWAGEGEKIRGCYSEVFTGSLPHLKVLPEALGNGRKLLITQRNSAQIEVTTDALKNGLYDLNGKIKPGIECKLVLLSPPSLGKQTVDYILPPNLTQGFWYLDNLKLKVPEGLQDYIETLEITASCDHADIQLPECENIGEGIWKVPPDSNLVHATFIMGNHRAQCTWQFHRAGFLGKDLKRNTVYFTEKDFEGNNSFEISTLPGKKSTLYLQDMHGVSTDLIEGTPPTFLPSFIVEGKSIKPVLNQPSIGSLGAFGVKVPVGFDQKTSKLTGKFFLRVDAFRNDLLSGKNIHLGDLQVPHQELINSCKSSIKNGDPSLLWKLLRKFIENGINRELGNIPLEIFIGTFSTNRGANLPPEDEEFFAQTNESFTVHQPELAKLFKWCRDAKSAYESGEEAIQLQEEFDQELLGINCHEYWIGKAQKVRDLIRPNLGLLPDLELASQELVENNPQLDTFFTGPTGQMLRQALRYIKEPNPSDVNYRNCLMMTANVIQNQNVSPIIRELASITNKICSFRLGATMAVYANPPEDNENGFHSLIFLNERIHQLACLVEGEQNVLVKLDDDQCILVDALPFNKNDCSLFKLDPNDIGDEDWLARSLCILSGRAYPENLEDITNLTQNSPRTDTRSKILKQLEVYL